MNSTKTCSKCSIEKPLVEFHKDKNKKDGIRSECKKCKKEQNKNYHREHREKCLARMRKYGQEHKKERRQKGNYKSMYENKNCPSYLGVAVAERLVKHLFKNVEVMPYGFPDYDFICNKNKKINVKSACITFTNGNPRWKFAINRNITADFFILVAFDNLTDLNPLHLWMILGNEINSDSSKSISLSTIDKWDKWKRDINDAKLCCAEIKSYNQSSKPLRF